MAKKSSTPNKSPDAIAILTADHTKVKGLFKEFEKQHEAEADDECEKLAKQICDELTIHATVEEEIFYPAVRAAIDDDDMLDEAEVEHASAKDLIAQIQDMSADDDKFAAKVIVLGELIDHHVKEEQDEMFPKAKKAKLDMAALGEQMLQRKEELKAEMGIVEGDDEEPTESGKGRKSSRGAPVLAGSK